MYISDPSYYRNSAKQYLPRNVNFPSVKSNKNVTIPRLICVLNPDILALYFHPNRIKDRLIIWVPLLYFLSDEVVSCIKGKSLNWNFILLKVRI